ncbi:leucine-rich repeat-containing serine/threonine-protein kinase [Poseidonibacter lekithochrous]|uniref:leucine-rich repeat-containing protein kinase family protein n=1 Tax=Poseidonibacter TaxID=2321187 RepID=UPI001C09AA29|nr:MULTISPECIES: leucine-rich repeat-containing protein kinase family protein [Poseidonibacter]MBU3015265.1 leucine-rich repeat-containing serine/threonine-protein kinase [Poseidonibacter lekithochrous]MDO6828563.1 leucine-rich repeat-containing protein kinase family protein [Poseidonibacter sp. 1_MG-2023]
MSQDLLKEIQAGKLKNATSVKMASGLKTFPIELYKLADTLEVLDLTDNNLSRLPDDFYRFKKLKRLFLSNNQFDHIPKVLAKLPLLSMIGIRNNQIKIFEEDSLPLSTRWLILTDNKLTSLPQSIGDLTLLQKCMLSGNQLTSLPNTISKCKNLELLRISANKLDIFPSTVLTLPKLAWLAYSGNPFCKKHPNSNIKLPTVKWHDLKIKELLGQGASGNIYKAQYQEKEVAVKIFKGEITSDGLPQEEMNINISMGIHKNLIDAIAHVSEHPEGKNALILELIPNTYTNLGLPPSLDSCTRDIYPSDFTLSLISILKILKDMASTALHMHQRGIMHGDFYAHNILIDKEADTILGDFGAASYYEEDFEIAKALEQIEVRAFGCLIEELLDISSKEDEKYKYIKDSLLNLQISCLNESIKQRPLFEQITKQLKIIK